MIKISFIVLAVSIIYTCAEHNYEYDVNGMPEEVALDQRSHVQSRRAISADVPVPNEVTAEDPSHAQAERAILVHLNSREKELPRPYSHEKVKGGHGGHLRGGRRGHKRGGRPHSESDSASESSSSSSSSSSEESREARRRHQKRRPHY